MEPRKARLKIRGFGWEDEAEVHEFDQARRLPYGQNVMIAVEERIVGTYEEFLAVAEENKEKDFLEIEIFPVLVGG